MRMETSERSSARDLSHDAERRMSRAYLRARRATHKRRVRAATAPLRGCTRWSRRQQGTFRCGRKYVVDDAQPVDIGNDYALSFNTDDAITLQFRKNARQVRGREVQARRNHALCRRQLDPRTA